MGVVLLTLRGPNITVDLEAPDDAPLGDLLPIFLWYLHIPVAPQTDVRRLWACNLVGVGPLDSTTSLAHAKTTNGALASALDGAELQIY
jgi:hypothetical protein